MDHFDKLIALVILGFVGVFVLMLLRRAAQVERAEREAMDPPTPALPAPIAVPPMIETPPSSPPIQEKPRKRMRTSPTAVQKAAPGAIDKVLDMLKNKDALATAFLLREILDKPVSRRP